MCLGSTHRLNFQKQSGNVSENTVLFLQGAHHISLPRLILSALFTNALDERANRSLLCALVVEQAGSSKAAGSLAKTKKVS